MITANDVTQYLTAHADFFEQHPEALNALTLSHPQGGRAVSLVERQVVSLREKNSQLEGKLRELLAFGSHNDVLADKLHRLTLALLRAPDLEMTVGVLVESLQTDFAIPFALVRWWDGIGVQSAHAAFSPVSEGMRNYVEDLVLPYVGQMAAHESRQWLPTDAAATAKSFAYVALRTDVCAGVLMLASDEAERFTPDMATDVLTRLGELATVSLERFVDFPTLQLA